MAAKTSKSKPSPAKKKTKTAAKKAVNKVAKKQPAATTVKKKAAKKAVKNQAPTKKAAKKAAKKAVPVKTAPKKAAKKAAPAKTAPKKADKKTTPAKTAPQADKKAPASEETVVKSSHSAKFIKKQQQRLLDLRDELLDAMSGMTRDTIRNAPEGSEASGSGQHQGDAGSDAYDRDFALSVLAKEQDALYEIEQALRRIEIGTYGVCEISFDKIPAARLEAIPFARLTVECQSQWEKSYGQRRFRPSDEVGFSGRSQLDDEDSPTVSLDDDA